MLTRRYWQKSSRSNRAAPNAIGNVPRLKVGSWSVSAWHASSTRAIAWRMGFSPTPRTRVMLPMP